MTRLRCGIEREGDRVRLSVRTRDGKTGATLDAHRRGAALLGAGLIAASRGDDLDGECEIRAELELLNPKDPNHA